MTYVTASIKYKINLNGEIFLLDSKKYHLIEGILDAGSITKAAKQVDISYRTALNYIDKIEDSLDIKLVNTIKGGKGGGGGASLTPEGYSILKECKKFNAMLSLHKRVNEIESVVTSIDEDKQVMTIDIADNNVNIPLNYNYEVGQPVLALINYDNIFIMLEPIKSSIGNILKGTIIELKLLGEIVRVKTKVDNIEVSCLVALASFKDLDLKIGKEIYLGFNAISVATLKL